MWTARLGGGVHLNIPGYKPEYDKIVRMCILESDLRCTALGQLDESHADVMHRWTSQQEAINLRTLDTWGVGHRMQCIFAKSAIFSP